MRNISDRPGFHFLLLAALCGMLYVPHLAKIPFYNKGEPREALVVQDIVAHGNWFFPLKGGADIPSKPPLFHWFGALTSRAWGQVTEANVRIPSAVFATLGVLVMYALGSRFLDPVIAFLGAAILATSLGYQSQAVQARVDMTLTFFITITLALFYALYSDVLRGTLWYYAFFSLLGLSALAKGPVSIILVSLVVATFLGLKKRWDFLGRLCFHPGVFAMAGIVLGWYGLALASGGGDFFSRQIIHENLARFFGDAEGGASHQKPFYYYVLYLFMEGLPWSLFLPVVLVDAAKRRTPQPDYCLFLLLWVVVVFVFFSAAAGKRSVYLLPLYPPLSLLIASWLIQSQPKAKVVAAGLKALGGFYLMIGLGFVAVLSAILAGKDLFWMVSHWGTVLKPNDHANLMAVFEKVSAEGWVFVLFALFLGALSGGVAWNLWNARLRGAAFLLIFAYTLASFAAQETVVAAIAEAKSYKAFMLDVTRQAGDEVPLYVYSQGWDYTSVAFYGGSRVSLFKGDRDELEQAWRTSDAYFILSEREWREIAASGSFAPAPILKSHGAGPDGRDHIVLLRGRSGPFR